MHTQLKRAALVFFAVLLRSRHYISLLSGRTHWQALEPAIWDAGEVICLVWRELLAVVDMVGPACGGTEIFLVVKIAERKFGLLSS